MSRKTLPAPIIIPFLLCACTAENPDYVPDVDYGGKRIFLTDNDYSGSETTYADDICLMSALSGQLTGKWVAWLSYISNVNPNAIDLVNDVGPWHDLDGKLVFQNKAALLQGPTNPVRRTNWGRQLPDGAPIWTGSQAGGTATNNLCLNRSVFKVWYSESKSELGDIAQVGQTGPSWTYSGSQPCNLRAHILCIEQ